MYAVTDKSSVTLSMGALTVSDPPFSLANSWSLTYPAQGSFTVDRFGRRRILLMATSGIIVCLIIVTALLSDTTSGNKHKSNAGIAFIYL